MKRFLADESGQGILEYGLILGLVAMIAVGALLILGNDTTNSLGSSASSLNRANAPYTSGTP